METSRSMRFARSSRSAVLAVLVRTRARRSVESRLGEYYARSSRPLFTDSYPTPTATGAPAVQTEQNALTTSIELGWKKHTNFLSAPIVRVTNRQGENHETATGLGDLGIGFRYGLKEGSARSRSSSTRACRRNDRRAGDVQGRHVRGRARHAAGRPRLPSDRVGIEDGPMSSRSASSSHRSHEARLRPGVRGRVVHARTRSSQKDSTQSGYMALHRQTAR
jgi:hypothetical protein